MKAGIILGLILVTSCSAVHREEKASREVASEKQVVGKRKYYKRRGTPHAKFSYDGYSAEFKKAKDSIRKNVGYMGVASKLRSHYFEHNLFDTGVDNASGIDCSKIMKRVRRTPRGRCYFDKYEGFLARRDKKLAREVMMGSLNQRFGRNVSPERSNRAMQEDMMNPNPLEVSRRLFNRKNGKTREANVINVLASAWLQAMNHDWFTHGKNSKTRHHQLPADKGHPHFKEGMKVPHTKSEVGMENSLNSHGYDYTSRNQVTHWWDASQIYGSDEATIKKVRGSYDQSGNYVAQLADGKVAVDEANKRLLYSNDSLPITGFHDNWWLGLELIHTIFHLEHNYIVDKVLQPQRKSLCKNVSRAECGEIFFEKARMINSALIAKIHTVEWTPALLDNSTLHLAMRANWYGFREVTGTDWKGFRKAMHKLGLFRGAVHLLSGLVGESTLNLYSTPFTLTEEFVAVYRMHPLIPEDITLRSIKNANKVAGKMPIKSMVFRDTPQVMAQQATTDWMLSFGTSHPGGMVLHNYPSFMQNFVAERNTGKAHGDSTRMDMGAIDIFRDRERGVPRYNELRRALKLPPAEDFTELVAGPVMRSRRASKRSAAKRELTKEQKEDIKTLAELYDNDIEKVDLLVGTLAEADRYPGYAFGNTPFYIFALMASRRLMVDPFFSDYYTPKYYTAPGIKHVQDQTMVDVIVRHFPQLKSQFYSSSGKQYVKNAFRPWGSVYKKVHRELLQK